ncbi:MAG: glycosyltransferase family 2 protein [Hyphomicrobiaceae bacterium]
MSEDRVIPSGGEPAAPRGGGRWALSVIVPVFNEERGVARLLARLIPVLEETGAAFEVVFVDDGSIDGTLAAVRAAHASDPRIKAISLSRNFGKEIAVTAGLRCANGDAAVLMDGDLQHPPEVIPDFIAGWKAGHDIVYGARLDRKTDSALRRMFSVAFYRLFGFLSGTKLHENAGDFRLFSRRALNAFNKLGERARFNKGLYAWIGYSVHAVPFEVTERTDGTGSKWSLRRLARFAIDGLASFSTLPLRVWSVLGLAVSLFAFGYIVVFLTKTLLFGVDTAGFPTLIISIMFFAGIQLVSLGVIGEYLGRIYDEVKLRPLYLVAEEIGNLRPEREP